MENALEPRLVKLRECLPFFLFWLDVNFPLSVQRTLSCLYLHSAIPQAKHLIYCHDRILRWHASSPLFCLLQREAHPTALDNDNSRGAFAVYWDVCNAQTSSWVHHRVLKYLVRQAEFPNFIFWLKSNGFWYFYLWHATNE